MGGGSEVIFSIFIYDNLQALLNHYFFTEFKNIKFSRSYSLRRKHRVSSYIGKSIKMWSNFNLNFGENDKDIEIFIVIAQLFFCGILYRCIKNYICNFIWSWFFSSFSARGNWKNIEKWQKTAIFGFLWHEKWVKNQKRKKITIIIFVKTTQEWHMPIFCQKEKKFQDTSSFSLKFQNARFAEKIHILDFKSPKIRRNIELSPILTWFLCVNHYLVSKYEIWGYLIDFLKS